MKKESCLLEEQRTRDQVKKLCIDTAMERNWTVPHREIEVKVSANNVTLSGTVHTIHARDEAVKIVMQSQGISSVNNKILVTFNNT
ncbi:MAG: BON domain-containing protein [Chitinophagaceae bacterium]